MATPVVVKLPIWKRIGNKIVESIKNLANDYSTVAKETATSCRERPVRTGILATAFGVVAYAYRTNPTEADYYNLLCEKRQTMVLIPESIHSELSDHTLSLHTGLSNEHRLQCYNLLFFSLLISTKHDHDVRVYQSQDSNLRGWPWQEVVNGFVDVGFFGRWYFLEKSFLNYDVRQSDIAGLPVEQS